MIEVYEVKSHEDIVAIAEAIAKASWLESSEINPADYSVENLQKCISNKQHVLCRAMLDGQFAGMASAFLMPKPSGEVWLYVDEVDVCSDCLQKGVGTALMKFLFEYAKNHNCNEVWLGTEKDNVAANALYASLKPNETEDFTGYTFKL